MFVFFLIMNPTIEKNKKKQLRKNVDSWISIKKINKKIGWYSNELEF